jgi:hypothetical protein
VKEKTPWFWIVKGFIAKCPNLIPTGVRNNTTGYDVSILQRGTTPDNRGEDHEGDDSPGVDDKFEGQSKSILTDELFHLQSSGEDNITEGKEVVVEAKPLEEGGDGHKDEFAVVGEKW